MYGAAGVHGQNLLVLLDSDKEGLNAKNRLDADLFVKDSRVLTLGSLVGQAKATIEDVVDRAAYLGALRTAGYAVTLNADEESIVAMVDAVAAAFSRLNLGAFDHVAKTKAALVLVDSWGGNPASVSAQTIGKACAVFAAVNSAFR
jgi:hypothetical protein